MKIVSWNVNGIRSVFEKGFMKFFEKENPDIFCIQELKAHEDQIPKPLLEKKNYFSFFNTAQKKGYSGVGVLSRYKPKKVIKKLGLERFDNEGRMLELHYGPLILIAVYIPNGGRDKRDMRYKLQTYTYLFSYLKNYKNEKVVIIGDFNIAHTPLDLARPKENENNTMFTPEERKQIDTLINLGFVDTFRLFEKGGGYYTWWPYFYNARARNLGWRIDYAFASHKLQPHISSSKILSEITGSDHCPIEIELAS